MSARIAVVLALLCVLMLTAGTHRRRQMQRRLADRVLSVDRYIDAHVRLHVVAKDPTGKETDPSKLTRLRTHELGGWIDTKAAPPRLMTDRQCGKGRDWYCSEDQEQVVFHASDAPVGKLALGGMGAGKTSAGVIWVYLRWLETLGQYREGGITAPTNARVKVVTDAIRNKETGFSVQWGRYMAAEQVFRMCDGTVIRCMSTRRQSEAEGSRIQGFNWSWWLGDELQDQTDEYINIHARLRSAEGGRGKRLATATEKDSPEWRTFKDKLVASGDWVTHSMLGTASPFIGEEHWRSMRGQLTDLEYRRFVLAEDLPSESRLYSAFDRKLNIRPVPLVGARKITSIVLSRKTGDKRDAIAMGHDPGAAKAGTIWADAYELSDRKGEVVWWVRGELFTLHKSAEAHALEALKITRDRFGCNVRPDSERAHVRCQPLGQAEDKPDLDIFSIWQRVGFNIRAAQYSKQGQGVGQIKKESRIGVVNTLFCNADGKRRLFIDVDDRGQPVAPLLVNALESMERDHLGRAERDEKNVKHDKSDLPAALGYLLWPFEKELAVVLRNGIAKELRA